MGPQHSQSLESWFMHVPGIKIAVPSNAADAYGLLRTALQRQQPRALRRERSPLRSARGGRDRRRPAIPFGRARIAREGTDVTVVALSGMVDEALTAADRLAERGISVEVIDPRTLAPLDMDTILGSLRKTMRLAVAHDAHRTLGFGAEIAARCMEEAFDYLDAPVERVACKDRADPVHAERNRGGLSGRRRRRRCRRAPRRMTTRDAAAALHLDGGRQGESLARRADGDPVSPGRSVVEVETDKATIEIEAPADGSSGSSRPRERSWPSSTACSPSSSLRRRAAVTGDGAASPPTPPAAARRRS